MYASSWPDVVRNYAHSAQEYGLPTKVWAGTVETFESVLIIGTKLKTVLDVLALEQRGGEPSDSRSMGGQNPENFLSCLR